VARVDGASGIREADPNIEAALAQQRERAPDWPSLVDALMSVDDPLLDLYAQ
jgi:hypothetical protein